MQFKFRLWLCRTLLDVDECRSKRPADTASDVAISTSKVKSSRRNVQRFDRFDSLRRIRISGKSTSASRNIIRTKLHVFFCFFSEWPFFYARCTRKSAISPLRAVSPRPERRNGTKNESAKRKKLLQRTQYSWYEKKGENEGSKNLCVHCKSCVQVKKTPFFDTTNIEFSARQKSAKFLDSCLSHYITL